MQGKLQGASATLHHVLQQLIIVGHGNINVKSGALVQFACGRYHSMMVFNDSFADGQPHARAFIFFLAMKSLEHFKDALIVLGIEADAVIGINKMTIVDIGWELLHFQLIPRNGFAFDVDAWSCPGF